MSRQVVFIHLLNDQSGSPKVLSEVISVLASTNGNGRLFVSSDGEGCLSQVDISISRYWYKRTAFPMLTLVTYLISQLCLFGRLVISREISRGAIIYVNTLLPFAAALFGRLTRRRVIYHLHEVSISPAPLNWLLMLFARLTASDLIYVSEFHRCRMPIGNVSAHVVHNCLSSELLQRSVQNNYRHRRKGAFNVLMLSSLRDYKGVPEFLNLANLVADHPDIRFTLVANDDELAVRRYFSKKILPKSVTVIPRSTRPGEFYEQASLVVNLSRPDSWLETFGLTILEAMAFGVPVVAPPVGGPVELIDDGVEGFLVDSRDVEALAKILKKLADDKALCLRLSAAAKARAAKFSPASFERNLRAAVMP